MRRWLFLLLAVVFCSSLAVVETAEAASKKEEAVALLKDLQQNTVGEVWINYDKKINLIEQVDSEEELQTAFNTLMVKEEDSEVLDKVSDIYFKLDLNPKAGGSYWTITGFVFGPDGKKAKGTVYW